MSADEAKTAILDVLKGLKLVDGETEKLFVDGARDIEFGALGIDSITVVDLCVGLEERIGREVSIEELIENATVNKLADHFAKENV
jgi:acyl carrier protein